MGQRAAATAARSLRRDQVQQLGWRLLCAAGAIRSGDVRRWLHADPSRHGVRQVRGGVVRLLPNPPAAATAATVCAVAAVATTGESCPTVTASTASTAVTTPAASTSASPTAAPSTSASPPAAASNMVQESGEELLLGRPWRRGG